MGKLWKDPPFLMGKLWKDPPFFMGTSTISTGPFSIANCWFTRGYVLKKIRFLGLSFGTDSFDQGLLKDINYVNLCESML
jgi:hypothetical protein